MTATLADVKAHLHIFHSVEDDYLQSLLKQSQLAVARMTGVSEGDEYDELVLNRVRYAYNDSLDEFEERYQSVLLGLSTQLLANEGESDETEV